MALDSGAGAYVQSRRVMINPFLARGTTPWNPRKALVHRYVVTAGVVPVLLGPALHDQVVQHRRGAEPEVERVQPLRTGDLAHRHEVADRVLGRPDPAGRLHRPPFPGGRVP